MSTAEEAKDILETLPGSGMLNVVRSGTCQGFRWDAEFRTGAGDHPQWEVSVGERRSVG